MRELVDNFYKLVFLIIIFGIVTGYVDYSRLLDGKRPIFSVSSYDSRTHVQTYRGLFYKAKRTIRVSPDERLSESSEIFYYIMHFHQLGEIPSNFDDDSLNFYVETKKSDVCNNSSLYYADETLKVYTYCLDSINLIDKKNKSDTLLSYLKKDMGYVVDIENNMGFLGLYSDDSTLVFDSYLDSFTNEGLTVYHCNKKYINDVYILPKGMAFQEDFCTYKDDDFHYIYSIYEEEHDVVLGEDGKDIPEPFFEDEVYRYEFDKVKKDYLYIVTPEVRGKSSAKYKLIDLLYGGYVTLDELQEKGLKFNKIDKAKEAEEKAKALEEARKKEEEERLKAEAAALEQQEQQANQEVLDNQNNNQVSEEKNNSSNKSTSKKTSKK